MKKKLFTTAVSLAMAFIVLTVPASAAGRPACRPHRWFCIIQCPSRPNCPVVPEGPQTPVIPENPEAPGTPDAPVVPDIPNTPEVPEVPDVPETPTPPVIPDSTPSGIQAIEQEAMRLVNQERTKNGLQPLTVSAELTVKARIKSKDMKENNYFSHNSPTYGSPFQMMKQLGITYRSAGENIAMGYSAAEAVVAAWMNSPSHRENILSGRYTSMGIGHDAGYWTQWFTG